MDAKQYDIEVLEPKELTNHLGFVKQGVRKYLDKDEVNEALDRIKNPREKMLLSTMWMTGLRVSEVISIRKRDIDFKNRTMNVRWLKSRKYHDRIIPIKNELCQMLQLYSADMSLDERIFNCTRQWVYTIVQRNLQTGPHALRHSFAVNFLRQSDSPHALVTLKELLGHKKIQTTMEYLKIVPSDMARELEKVNFT